MTYDHYEGAETRHDEIVPGFLDAIKEFSYEDFFHYSKVEEGYGVNYLRLHIPAFIGAREDRYFHALFSESHRLMQNTFAESGEHSYYGGSNVSVSLARGLEKALARQFGGAVEEDAVHEWNNMYPEVAEFIAAKGPEVEDAFLYVIESARKYKKATANTNTVSRETHGLTGEEEEKLDAALKTIWAAYPETDPRILEGYEMVVGAEPLVKEAFPRYAFGNFSFEERDLETAFREDKPLEAGLTQTKEGVLRSAENYRDNFGVFKEFAPAISERVLAVFLNHTVHFERDRGYKTALEFQESIETARAILAELDTHPDRTSEIAGRIAAGEYGALIKERSMMENDEAWKTTLGALDHAGDYLEFVLNVRSGQWFDAAQDKLGFMIDAAREAAEPVNAPAKSAPQPAATL